MKKSTKKNPILPKSKGLTPYVNDKNSSDPFKKYAGYLAKNPDVKENWMGRDIKNRAESAATQMKVRDRKAGKDGSLPTSPIERDIKRQQLLERYKKSGGLASKKSTKPAPMAKPKMVKKKKN